jgi:hypothetical protein
MSKYEAKIETAAIESAENLPQTDYYVDIISLVSPFASLVDETYLDLISQYLEEKIGTEKISKQVMLQDKKTWGRLWEDQTKKFSTLEDSNLYEIPAQICVFLVDATAGAEELENLVVFAENINPLFQSMIVVDPYEIIYAKRFADLLPRFIKAGLISNILNLEEKKGKLVNIIRKVKGTAIEVTRETRGYNIQSLNYLDLLIQSEAQKQFLIRKTSKNTSLSEVIKSENENPIIKISENAEIDPANKALTIKGKTITLSNYEYSLMTSMLKSPDNIVFLTEEYLERFINQKDTGNSNKKDLILKAKGNIMVIISRLRPIVADAKITLDSVRKKKNNNKNFGGYKLTIHG